ncbi:hypothetical protein ACFL34_04955 [Candidatus Sumerlaeota bacterium]
MSYRRLILMVSLVGLVVPGAIAGESKIDKKLSKEAPLFERIKLRGALRDDVSRDVSKPLGNGQSFRLALTPAEDWGPGGRNPFSQGGQEPPGFFPQDSAFLLPLAAAAAAGGSKMKDHGLVTARFVGPLLRHNEMRSA